MYFSSGTVAGCNKTATSVLIAVMEANDTVHWADLIVMASLTSNRHKWEFQQK